MKGKTQDLVYQKNALRLVRTPLGDAQFSLSVENKDQDSEDPREISCELLAAQDGWVQVRLHGVTRRARVLRRGGITWVSVQGENYRFDPPARRSRGGGSGGETRVEAPMPGTVLEVLVANGDSVEEGQDLLVVEAMKMEHRLRAGKPGVIRNLQVAVGDRVDAGVALLEVEAESEEANS